MNHPPLEGVIRGIHRRGWDFLSARFEETVLVRRELLSPSSWLEVEPQELAKLFSDSQFGERLTDCEGRAALVRDLGKVMSQGGCHWIDELHACCQARIASGAPNLLKELTRFQAYRDPVKKKSFFFLSLMRNAGLWQFTDEEQLRPPVDYHEVRGHLRIGTVRINNADLRRRLQHRLPVNAAEDVAIRQKTSDAIMLLTELSGIENPSQLHYLFWNVFRSCCTREAPHCQGCPPNCTLQQRYVHLAGQAHGDRRCPFTDVCGSAETSERYCEPVFETDYY